MTIDEALYTKKTLKSGLYEVLYRKVEVCGRPTDNTRFVQSTPRISYRVYCVL